VRGGDCARVKRDVLEHNGLARKHLTCGERGLDRGRGQEDVGLERVGLGVRCMRWSVRSGEGGTTLWGTINAIGSMALVVSLYACAISHSGVLTTRRGTKRIPRCGSLDLCSSKHAGCCSHIQSTEYFHDSIALSGYRERTRGEGGLRGQQARRGEGRGSPGNRMLLSLQNGITTSRLV
jgi:hypothetical protein